MYLFTRTARLSGRNMPQAMAWAVQLTESIGPVTGVPASLWAPAFSREVGTLIWSAIVPDLKTLETALGKLDTDREFSELAERGNDFGIPGSLNDRLARYVNGAPDPESNPQYIGVVQATTKVGRLARGVSLGVEIAQTAEKVTGTRTLFVTDLTGNYGGVAWLTAYAGINELERASDALAADQSFVELIDTEVPGVYNDHPGSATQDFVRRIV